MNKAPIDFYSQRDSAKLLNITVNQFNYFATQKKIVPAFRAGCKYTNVLYSKEQLRDLKLSLNLKRYKLSDAVESKVIELARQSNYSKKIWAITFQDIIRETKICFEDDLSNITKELSNLNTEIRIMPIFQPFT